MNLAGLWTATRQWVPFVARTVGYGSLSCFAGPFTRGRASLWAMRQWCVSSVRGLDITVEFSGADNVPTAGPFVYCSNHQSLVDILVLGAVLPGDYKWAAKRSLMNIPFLGWHLRLAGHVPVDRGRGGTVAEQVIERFIAVLREGKPLLIFPEGTRTLDGELRQFRAGAFKAALGGEAPVVPVALDGTFHMMSKGAVSAAGDRKVVRVRIGEPIGLPPAGEEAERIAELMDRTRAAVGELLDGLRAPG